METPTTTPGERANQSPLFRRMLADYANLAAEIERSDWPAMCAKFMGEGLTKPDGTPLDPTYTRKTFFKVSALVPKLAAKAVSAQVEAKHEHEARMARKAERVAKLKALRKSQPKVEQPKDATVHPPAPTFTPETAPLETFDLSHETPEPPAVHPEPEPLPTATHYTLEDRRREAEQERLIREHEAAEAVTTHEMEHSVWRAVETIGRLFRMGR